jgi:hypothetical protein
MDLAVSMRVPAFSIPALKGASGAKVKDMCLTSGARISISSTNPGDAFTEVSISGTQHSVRLATRLIKMAVLHGRAGDKVPPPGEYHADKKAEAELDTLVFYRESQARAFNTLYPVPVEPDSHNI